MVKLLFFCFLVTNSRLKNKKFHFELLTRWVHFYFVTFELTNMKLINAKISLIISISKWYGLTHSITFFVFSLLCCKYICDIYLSMLDFNSLYKFNIFINKINRMQVYIIIMKGKQNFFIWNGLAVDRLTWPGLMSLWSAWGWSCKFINNLTTSK